MIFQRIPAVKEDMLNLKPEDCPKKGSCKKRVKHSDTPKDISEYLDFLEQLRISDRPPKPPPKNFKKPFRL